MRVHITFCIYMNSDSTPLLQDTYILTTLCMFVDLDTNPRVLTLQVTPLVLYAYSRTLTLPLAPFLFDYSDSRLWVAGIQSESRRRRSKWGCWWSGGRFRGGYVSNGGSRSIDCARASSGGYGEKICR